MMMVAGIALVVLYIPMSVGVYRLLERSTTAWYGTTAVVFGLAVLLPAYLVNLLPPLAFVPLAGELGTIGGEVLYADYSVARIAAELFFTVGSVLSLAVGPFLWGLAWMRPIGSSRWIGWTALITGVTGLVWFVWLIESSVVSTTLIVNVLMSLVFFAAASVALVARGRLKSRV